MTEKEKEFEHTEEMLEESNLESDSAQQIADMANAMRDAVERFKA